MGKMIICPYCYSEHKLKKMGKKCINENCSAYTMQTVFSAKTINCPESTCDMLLRYSCANPKCGKVIEFDELNCNSPLPFAVIGAKFSGKSNYIAALVRSLQVNGKNFGVTLRANALTAKRYTRDYENPVFKDSKPAGTTQTVTVGSAIPLIFMLTTGMHKSKRNRTTFPLSFYDTAGENLQKSKDSVEQHVAYVAYSKGIILLVDPWQIPYVRKKLGSKIPVDAVGPAPFDILERVIDVIKNVNIANKKMKSGEKIKIPIAIAFSKIDSLDKGGLLHENSILKSESEHLGVRKYSLVEHKNTNDEITSLLEEWDEDEAKRLINLIDGNFEKYAFFGLSSFGCGVIGSKLEQKAQPRRVLDPFLWLLSLNKRVDTKKLI